VTALTAGLSSRRIEASGLPVFDAWLFTEVAFQTLCTGLPSDLVVAAAAVSSNTRLEAFIKYLTLRARLPANLVVTTNSL
jgi:hypothetical protein